VVRKCCVPNQHSVVPDRWHLIADRFGGFRRNNGEDRRAKPVEGVARGFRNSGEVFLDSLRAAFTFRGGPTLASFSFFS